jgi:(p)ppGpp synthase/HD superfamily hydrolase
MLTTNYVLANGDPMLRSSRSPITSHLLSTAMQTYWILFNNPVAVLAALLHDIVEDFPTTFTVASIAALTNNEVAATVDGLTKRDPESYADHILEASIEIPSVGPIKLCDFSHNVITLGGFKPSKRWRWIQKVTHQYLPMFDAITEHVPGQARDQYLALLAQTISTLRREESELLADASSGSYVELTLQP